MRHLPIRLLSAAWAVLCLGTATSALGSGAGLDLIYNETDRLAHPSVPASVESSVVRERAVAFWHQEADDRERLNVELEHENYALRAASGADLVDLSLLKLHPRYRRRHEGWAADVGVLALEVGRNDALYAAVPQDDRNRFILPAVVVDLTPGRLRFRGGVWEEYEVLPLNANLYTFSAAQVAVLGAGLRITPDAEARVEAQKTHRFYPETFTLDRTGTLGEFRLRDPLDGGAGALWREAALEAARQQYPVTGDSFNKLTLGSVLFLQAIGATHFLTPQLEVTDSYVVYGPGSAPETLLEYTVRGNDAVLRLNYEGFRRLGASPWFVAWGGSLESSVVRGVRHALIVHLKVEHTY